MTPADTQGATLGITDARGWSKHYPLTSRLVSLGSAPDNEVCLPDTTPYCAQLISQRNGAGFSLVRLGGDEVAIASGSNRHMLEPLQPIVLSGDTTFWVKTYTAQLRVSPAPAMASAFTAHCSKSSKPFAHNPKPFVAVTSPHIGAQVELSPSLLTLAQPLAGRLRIRNLGDVDNVSFVRTLEGFPEAYSNIEPPPVLHPQGESVLDFVLQHPRGPVPSASRSVQMAFVVKATSAYSGASICVPFEIEVEPFFKHHLCFKPRQQP